MKGYEKESFLAPLFKMLEATFELIVPLVVANIMDIGIKNQDNAYIWHQCVIMVLLGVIGLVCALTAQYFSAKAAMGFSTALRKEMFAHISKLSYRELDQLGTPTLVTRITNDVNQAQTGVNMVLRLFLDLGCDLCDYANHRSHLQKGTVLPGPHFPDHQREPCRCQSGACFWKTAGRV